MIGIPSQQYRKKPTMQQTELADLHFVDAKRIKELGNAAELPAYRTMVRCLDETSVEKNREQLEALLRAFGKERQHFIDLLFTRDHRAFCIGNRWRKLRDTLVMEKYRSSYGLQARHWKMALQTAAATVSNYWRLVQANALSRIRRKDWFARLNKLEQRYVYFLLGSLSEDFFTMLDGKCPSVVTDTEKESVASRKGLCKAMVRTIHDEQGKRPKHGRDASVWFDCSCYKALVVGEQVRLDLMSLTPGVRLTLYVKGCVPVSSTLKLVKHPDGTMALHVQKSMSKADIRPIDSPKASRGKLYCRALDLGFTEVATDDAGNRFGTYLGEKLTGYAQYLDAKLKERNKLMARAQKAGKAKRRRMLRCNLGSKKFTKELQRIRTEIQNTVNKALNDILKQSPAQVYALEDLSHRFTFEGKYSRKVRNLLSKWVRGTIKERFLFKAAKAGAQVVFVPAAYSSQHCPQCGYTAGENRRGDRFESASQGQRSGVQAVHDQGSRQKAGTGPIRSVVQIKAGRADQGSLEQKEAQESGVKPKKPTENEQQAYPKESEEKFKNRIGTHREPGEEEEDRGGKAGDGRAAKSPKGRVDRPHRGRKWSAERKRRRWNRMNRWAPD